MIYPQDFETKLGFDQIRQLIKENCLSTLGEDYLQKMNFSKDFDLINRLLDQTNEFKQILERQLLFPSQNYIDVTAHLKRINIEGFFLEPQVFFEIKISLNTIQKSLYFFEETEEFPQLKSKASQVSLDKSIIRKINDVIDDKGLIRDNASEELKNIRRSILEEESTIRKELEKILRALVKDGATGEDSAITIRQGRMVIPVLAEYKRKVKGFIHGESGTGQTVYIEPTQILDINNEIQDLKNREKREIVRILTELTAYIGFYQPQLQHAYKFLGLLDFVRSKAKVAMQLLAIKPQIVSDTIIDLHDARHPLLQLSFNHTPKQVIPLSVKLDYHARLLLISGPNAGGKSICLKTIGLLQYMLQCGCLIPCSEHSKVGFFENIFLDIGDEQSIENDLSTYSSHLSNMKYFLKFGQKKTLILIDEFGGGTEPHFGAAIAETILEEFKEMSVFGVITTHFSNLKSLAENTKGMTNGAMAFNMEALEPLFKLEMGVPGSSFALELAQKIGLPTHIIEKSKTKIGASQINLDELIRKLEDEKAKFQNKNLHVKTIEKKYLEKEQHYEKLVSDLEVQKNKYLSEAKAKAKLLLAEVNQKIEQSIRQIKENNADKVITKAIREDLKKLDAEISKPIAIPISKKPVVEVDEDIDDRPLKVGDWVKIKDMGTIGKLLSIANKDAEIAIGALNSKIKVNRLVRASRKEYREVSLDENRNVKNNLNLNEKLSHFSPNVDYRGMSGDDAIRALEQLLDEALLFNIKHIKIVHGKGDGILRKLIRENLTYASHIKSIKDEHADRGGAGVTLIELK